MTNYFNQQAWHSIQSIISVVLAFSIKIASLVFYLIFAHHAILKILQSIDFTAIHLGKWIGVLSLLTVGIIISFSLLCTATNIVCRPLLKWHLKSRAEGSYV